MLACLSTAIVVFAPDARRVQQDSAYGAGVPLPRRLAYFNRKVTNRLFSPLAGRVPPWAIVEHVGRRSGRRYRTVLWAFPRRRNMIIVLTYGPASDWVRNVVASQSCRVKWAGRWRQFASAEIVEG